MNGTLDGAVALVTTAKPPFNSYRYCLDANRSNLTALKGYCTVINIVTFVSGYILPGYIAVGLIANLHIIYIFQFRVVKKTRQMIYLSFVAIADFLNIIVVGWLRMFITHGLSQITRGHYNIDLFFITPLSCTLFYTFHNFTSCFACSMFVVFCLDRFVAIYWPLRAHTWSLKTAWKLSIACILVCVGISFPFAVVTRKIKEDGIESCTMQGNTLVWVVYVMLFTNCGIVQSCLIVFFNIALIVRVKQMNSKRRHLVKTEPPQSTSTQIKEIRATLLIIVLSIVFICCAIPQATFYALMFLSALQENSDINQIMFYLAMEMLSWIPFLFQESISWFIYFARMPVFREQCCKLPRCNKRSN